MTDFDSIYLLYFSRLCRFASQYTGSAEDAESLVQDVFISAWEKRDTWIITLPLLYTAVKTKCIDYLRHRMVTEKYNRELSYKIASLEYLDNHFASEQDLEQIVQKALDRLPDKCRNIFLKSRLEGKKYKEIAEELGLSVNTVENQMAIALKKLKKDLQQYLVVKA